MPSTRFTQLGPIVFQCPPLTAKKPHVTIVMSLFIRGRVIEARALERPEPRIPRYSSNSGDLGMDFERRLSTVQVPKLVTVPRPLWATCRVDASLGKGAAIRAWAIIELKHHGLAEGPTAPDSMGSWYVRQLSKIAARHLVAEWIPHRPLGTQGTYMDASHPQLHKTTGSRTTGAGLNSRAREFRPAFLLA
jgi:hypothetical protein